MQTSFIYAIANHLPLSVCDDIVTRFERDPRKAKGLINNKVLNETIKTTLELPLSAFEEWKDVDSILFDSLQSGYKEYIGHLSKTNNKVPLFANIRDKGYTIEKYPAMTGFHQWHTDFGVYVEKDVECRIVGFKWCLTNMQMNFGIDTDTRFSKGTMLFYPSTWTIVHEVEKTDTNTYCISGGMVVDANSSSNG
jgi:hypothetical protein